MGASPDPKDLAKLSFIDYTHDEAASVVGWRIRASARFERWYARLADDKARRLVSDRIERLVQGHLGDTRGWGGGIWELRIHYGPGLRVYFAYLEERVILLLGGGAKRGQRADVELARTTYATQSRRRT